MKETIISSSLLKETLEHFEDFKEKFPNIVIQKSLPILFFGDINSYMNNEFKIVTAALNPSDVEFKKSKDERRYSTMFRFKDFDGSHESLEKAYSNYFKFHPYEWFGKNKNKHLDKGFKPILNGMGYCYYPNNNELKSVLHTDLCSPLATNPTWSDLSKSEKNELTKSGFLLWKKLIKEIKPNLILMSIAKKEIERLNPEFIETIHEKNDSYKINLYHINIDGFNTKLVWGNAQNTPFQPFKNKFQLGELIRSKVL